MMMDTVKRLSGTVGEVAGYTVIALGDDMAVFHGDEEVAFATVRGLGKFAASARELRVAFGETPDFRIVYLTDRRGDGFGYALNLDWPDGSEWGYAPMVA